MKYFICLMCLCSLGCMDEQEPKQPPKTASAPALSHMSIEFSKTAIGAPVQFKFFIINPGDVPMRVEGVALAEAQVSDQDDELSLVDVAQSFVISPGEQQLLLLEWSPVNETADVGELRFEVNQREYTINVSTPALEAVVEKKGVLTVSTDMAVELPFTLPGSMSSATVTLSNTGDAPLEILASTLMENELDTLMEFSLEGAPMANQVLDPEESINVEVVWTPQNLIYDQAKWVISHSEGVETVEIKTAKASLPNVPAGAIELSRRNVLMSPVSLSGQITERITLTNTSASAIELGAPEFVHENNAVQLSFGASIPQTIAAMSSIDVELTWTYDDPKDTLSSTLFIPAKVQSHALDRVEIPILLNGIHAFEDGPLVFEGVDSQEAVTRMMVFKNTTATPIQVKDVLVINTNSGVKIERVSAQDFNVVESSMGLTVAPGESLYFRVGLTSQIFGGVSTLTRLCLSLSTGLECVDAKTNINTPLLSLAGVSPRTNTITFNDSTPRTIQLENAHRALPLIIKDIYITNHQQDGYVLVADMLPEALRAGQDLVIAPLERITIGVKQTSVASSTGYLTIRTNAPGAANVKIALKSN